MGAPLLYAIHGATVENILFKDGDGANIFRAFNQTQVFLHLKNNYHQPTFVQYKKNHINLFNLLQYEKNSINTVSVITLITNT